MFTRHEEKPMAETSTARQRRERILVINDDTTFLALMEELLQEIRATRSSPARSGRTPTTSSRRRGPT